jgi:hypothetical protein
MPSRLVFIPPPLAVEVDCGKANRNFDLSLVPGIERQREEECAQGHPSPLLLEEDQKDQLPPIDYFCRLCGKQLLFKESATP